MPIIGKSDDKPLAVVTGGAGFLGRHFVAELVRRGYAVEVVDTATPVDGTGRLADVRYAAIYKDCRAWFQRSYRRPVDLVIHCAALVGGRSRIDGTPLDLSVNLELDAAYARWLVRARPRQAVYVSSSAVYPVWLQDEATRQQALTYAQHNELARPAGFRLYEGMQGFGPPDSTNDFTTTRGIPDQVYGWTKLVGEELMSRVQDAGVQVTVVRPFSGYGSDQDLSYPFPAFADRAARRLDPFDVWGDGLQVRDFIHVDDVVKGTLALVRAAVTEPTNVCTGDGTAFGDLARLFGDAAGYEPTLRFHADAPQGVRYRVGDPTRFNRYYTPTVALADGVKAALRHRTALDRTEEQEIGNG